jgi:hypothetical protein
LVCDQASVRVEQSKPQQIVANADAEKGTNWSLKRSASIATIHDNLPAFIRLAARFERTMLREKTIFADDGDLRSITNAFTIAAPCAIHSG